MFRTLKIVRISCGFAKPNLVYATFLPSLPSISLRYVSVVVVFLYVNVHNASDLNALVAKSLASFLSMVRFSSFQCSSNSSQVALWCNLQAFLLSHDHDSSSFIIQLLEAILFSLDAYATNIDIAWCLKGIHPISM